MHTKHPPIHHRPQTQIVKYITTISPHVTTSIFPLTLVVESVDLGDLTRFMITPYEGYTIWIADFEEKEEQECFDGIEASINEVAYWRISCAERESGRDWEV
jgi:hypothetical protein